MPRSVNNKGQETTVQVIKLGRKEIFAVNTHVRVRDHKTKEVTDCGFTWLRQGKKGENESPSLFFANFTKGEARRIRKAAREKGLMLIASARRVAGIDFSYGKNRPRPPMRTYTMTYKPKKPG